MLSMIDFLHIPTCCYLEIFSMHSPFLTFFTFFTFGVTMTKLTSYLRRGTGLYILGIASMIISVSRDMLAPQLTKHLIDDVIPNEAFSTVSNFFYSSFMYYLNENKQFSIDLIAKCNETQRIRIASRKIKEEL